MLPRTDPHREAGCTQTGGGILLGEPDHSRHVSVMRYGVGPCRPGAQRQEREDADDGGDEPESARAARPRRDRSREGDRGGMFVRLRLCGGHLGRELGQARSLRDLAGRARKVASYRASGVLSLLAIPRRRP